MIRRDKVYWKEKKWIYLHCRGHRPSLRANESSPKLNLGICERCVLQGEKWRKKGC